MTKKRSYSEQLRDPRWQKLRLEILQQTGWRCMDCLSSKDTLNVHHTFYISGWAPWDYPLESLLVLCDFCHELRGNLEKQLLGAMAFFDTANMQELIQYLLLYKDRRDLPAELVGAFSRQLAGEAEKELECQTESQERTQSTASTLTA